MRRDKAAQLLGLPLQDAYEPAQLASARRAKVSELRPGPDTNDLRDELFEAEAILVEPIPVSEDAEPASAPPSAAPAAADFRRNDARWGVEQPSPGAPKRERMAARAAHLGTETQRLVSPPLWWFAAMIAVAVIGSFLRPQLLGWVPFSPGLSGGVSSALTSLGASLVTAGVLFTIEAVRVRRGETTSLAYAAYVGPPLFLVAGPVLLAWVVIAAVIGALVWIGSAVLGDEGPMRGGSKDIWR